MLHQVVRQLVPEALPEREDLVKAERWGPTHKFADEYADHDLPDTLESFWRFYNLLLKPVGGEDTEQEVQ